MTRASWPGASKSGMPRSEAAHERAESHWFNMTLRLLKTHRGPFTLKMPVDKPGIHGQTTRRCSTRPKPVTRYRSERVSSPCREFRGPTNMAGVVRSWSMCHTARRIHPPPRIHPSRTRRKWCMWRRPQWFEVSK